ncbi:MAG: DUF2185 domain-containing protein [Telluria sp.]
MASWELEDAASRAAANKYTFYRPRRELIAAIAPGAIVKLVFLFESDNPENWRAERMWVSVDFVGPDGTFRGRLDNDPRYIKDLQCGDVVLFDARHIINIHGIDDRDNLIEKYIKRCYVSARIYEDGVPVGYFYRDEPGSDEDSGWCFMGGDETENYLSDSSKLRVLSLGRLLSYDDSMIHLLASPVGSEFELDPDSQQFRKL